MKKFIIIIQASGFVFKKVILKANNRNELYPMYRNLGMSVSIMDYSAHNDKMADLQVDQYNSI